MGTSVCHKKDQEMRGRKKPMVDTRLFEAVKYASALYRENHGWAESVYLSARLYEVSAYEVSAQLRKMSSFFLSSDVTVASKAENENLEESKV